MRGGAGGALNSGCDGGAGLSEGFSAAKNSCANSSSWWPSTLAEAMVCGLDSRIWALTSLSQRCRRGAK